MDYDDHGDHDHDGDGSEYLVPRADTDRIICPLATHRGKIRRADKDLWNCMYTVYIWYMFTVCESQVAFL